MSTNAFQWDNANRKHAIYDHPERDNTQDEIESLFDDPAFVAMDDPKHSNDEKRYNAVARSNQNRILFVVYVVRDGYIRPISCRPANQNERNEYGQISPEEEAETPDRAKSLGDEE
jgi:uncharacterized DUF497 family protein